MHPPPLILISVFLPARQEYQLNQFLILTPAGLLFFQLLIIPFSFYQLIFLVNFSPAKYYLKLLLVFARSKKA